MKKDKNKFVHDYLGIEITKPDHWEFMPGAWADHSKNNFAGFEEFAAENGLNPAVFVMMYRPDKSMEIYPTVQCRLSYNEGKDFSEIKQEILGSMNELFSSAEIVEDTDDFLLSGKLCSSTKLKLVLKDMFDDEIRFQSQQLVVTYPKYFIMIAFSGPIEGPYVCTEDFMSIMRSIKLRF